MNEEAIRILKLAIEDSKEHISFCFDFKGIEALEMAIKALNFKMEESDILDMKQVAGVFHMSVTDLIKNAVKQYITELKNDPFYRLTANVEAASEEETEEILAEIESLSDDDLTISSTKTFTV